MKPDSHHEEPKKHPGLAPPPADAQPDTLPQGAVFTEVTPDHIPVPRPIVLQTHPVVSEQKVAVPADESEPKHATPAAKQTSQHGKPKAVVAMQPPPPKTPQPHGSNAVAVIITLALFLFLGLASVAYLAYSKSN